MPAKSTNRKTTEQIDSLWVKPARDYGALGLEYCEKLMSAQLDAARTITDLSLAQMRTWIDVRDTEGFQKAMEDQHKAVQEMGERMKGEAEAFSALSQEFMQKSQALFEESMKSAAVAK